MSTGGRPGAAISELEVFDQEEDEPSCARDNLRMFYKMVPLVGVFPAKFPPVEDDSEAPAKKSPAQRLVALLSMLLAGACCLMVGFLFYRLQSEEVDIHARHAYMVYFFAVGLAYSSRG